MYKKKREFEQQLRGVRDRIRERERERGGADEGIGGSLEGRRKKKRANRGTNGKNVRVEEAD